MAANFNLLKFWQRFTVFDCFCYCGSMLTFHNQLSRQRASDENGDVWKSKLKWKKFVIWSSGEHECQLSVSKKSECISIWRLQKMKDLGNIIFSSTLFVQKIIIIPPAVNEIFSCGHKWWAQSHAASMAEKNVNLSCCLLS